jgi:multiple sugar transport system permease protein
LNSKRLRRQLVRISFTYLAYLAVLVVFLGPILYLVWGSLHRTGAIASTPPDFTAPITFANYAKLFGELEFGRYLMNSIAIAGGSTLVGLAAGSAASYCIARLDLKLLSVVTLVARMAPGVMFLIPIRVVAERIGALDSVPLNYALLVFVHLIITLPVCVWLLIPFFEAIPRGVLEAAELDGCSVHQAFWRIALPMVRPGLAVATIIAFVFSWNYFLFALGLASAKTVTLPVIAFSFIGIGQLDWGGLMAAAVVIAAPTTLLVFAAQGLLVRGLIAGAMK